MRYRKVRFSGYMLVMLSMQDHESLVKCIKGLPEGTKFAYSIPDSHYGIWLVIEHPSFDLLIDGQEIPDHPDPVFEKIR